MTVLTQNKIFEILDSVTDPEIPVLTIADLGIIRKVEFVAEEDCWEIHISPTYSGCPAMDMIFTQIRMSLYAHDISNFRIKQVLSPAWTTDWMTETGKEKLRTYGIAPPDPSAGKTPGKSVVCPNCGSSRTSIISEFGSTACKSLYKCDDCLEPFDYFKCH